MFVAGWRIGIWEPDLADAKVVNADIWLSDAELGLLRAEAVLLGCSADELVERALRAHFLRAVAGLPPGRPERPKEIDEYPFLRSRGSEPDARQAEDREREQ